MTFVNAAYHMSGLGETISLVFSPSTRHSSSTSAKSLAYFCLLEYGHIFDMTLSVHRLYASCLYIPQMSKHMLMLKDASLHEIIGFLDAADQHGHNIPTQIGPQVIHSDFPCS